MRRLQPRPGLAFQLSRETRTRRPPLKRTACPHMARCRQRWLPVRAPRPALGLSVDPPAARCPQAVVAQQADLRAALSARPRPPERSSLELGETRAARAARRLRWRRSDARRWPRLGPLCGTLPGLSRLAP